VIERKGFLDWDEELDLDRTLFNLYNISILTNNVLNSQSKKICKIWVIKELSLRLLKY